MTPSQTIEDFCTSLSIEVAMFLDENGYTGDDREDAAELMRLAIDGAAEEVIL